MTTSATVQSQKNIFLSEMTEADLKSVLNGENNNIRPLVALFELYNRDVKNLSLLFKNNLNANDPDIRAAAVTALGNVRLFKKGLSENKSLLVESLQDESPQVVRRAAEILGHIGGKSELNTLNTLIVNHPLSKRAVDTAKILLNYKLGNRVGLLEPLPEKSLLSLLADKTRPIAARSICLSGKPLAEDVQLALGDKDFADNALSIECGKWNYLLALRQSVLKKGGASLFQKSHQIGLLLRKEQVSQQYFRYGNVLSHPEEKALRLFVMSDSGRLLYTGVGTNDSKRSLDFFAQAVSSTHTFPIEFAGALNTDTAAIKLVRAKVAISKQSSQPQKMLPRRIENDIV